MHLRNVIPALTLITFIAFSFSSCGLKEGPIVTQQRSVSHFTGIQTGYGIKVIVTKGSVQQVTIEAPDNFMQYISTNVAGNKLSIQLQQPIQNQHVSTLNVYLTVDTLDYIDLSGAAQLTTTDLFYSNNLSTTLSGASKLDFHAVVANNFYCDASGASMLNIDGSVIGSHLTFSGASKMDGFDFYAQNVTIDASGASSLNVRASTSLDVTASGASTIRYKGYPAITQLLSGGSTLESAN